MNSKDWKLGVLALAAMSLLAACSHNKKDDETSNFAGVWLMQDNVKDYSQYQADIAAGDRAGFCSRVEGNYARYSDSNNLARAITVQTNGEVFTYVPGANPLEPSYRARYFIGTVSNAGLFTAGRIGPNGAIITSAGWAAQQSQYDMPRTSTMERQGDALSIYSSDGDQQIWERYDDVTAKRYTNSVRTCISQHRRTVVTREEQRTTTGQRQQPQAPQHRVLPQDQKDYDPDVDGQPQQ